MNQLNINRMKTAKIKKIGLVYCFLIIASGAFGQQFLWSTENDSDLKYIPLDSVQSKVLNYYDHYEYYHDGVGYSKSKFLKYLEKYGDDSEVWDSFKRKIEEMEDFAAFALRDNLGQGSVILVILVSKENVNMVSFSNFGGMGDIATYQGERDKFAKWFKTLLN